jgi:hypothetical protein
MQRIRSIAFPASMAVLIGCVIGLPLSSVVAVSVGAKKINSATGLMAERWKASVVYGLLFVSRLDSTLGTPVSGEYVPESGIVPAATEWYLQARPFTHDLTPYISFGATPYAGNNGCTSVAVPLWPAAVLSSIYPAVLLARGASRKWRMGGKPRRTVLIFLGLAVVCFTLALPLAWAARAKREAAESVDAEFNGFSYQLNLFGACLQGVAWDNGGACPCKTLPDAIAAVERGSSLDSGELARAHCPSVLRGRDPWGQPLIYEWSDGGWKVSIRSLGPPGSGRPINISLELEKRTF